MHINSEISFFQTEALPIHQALLLMSTSVQDIQVQPTKLTKLSIVSKMVENEVRVCVRIYIHTRFSSMQSSIGLLGFQPLKELCVSELVCPVIGMMPS